MESRRLPRSARAGYTAVLLLAAVAWHVLGRFHDVVSLGGIGALVVLAVIPLPALLWEPDRFVERVGQAVAGVPVVGGVLLGTYLAFVPHLVSDPDTPSALVTISGIDCVLGNHVATSCLALGESVAILTVSLAIGYFVYERAAGYLLAVAGLFGVAGVVMLGFDDNLAQVLLVAALLLAVGALIMEPEMVTERLRDGLDGRSETE